MTVVTTRPDGTTSSFWALTGSTVHGALADDSDATFVSTTTNTGFIVTLANPSVPAGAVVKRIQARMRTHKAGAATTRVTLSIQKASTGEDLDGAQPLVTSTSPVTMVVVSVDGSTVDTDDIRFALASNISGSGTLYIEELYFDTTYVAQPTLTVDAPSGTITDTNLPTVSWTPTLDADGGAQALFRVRIYNEAQYTDPSFDPDILQPEFPPIADSGVVLGTAAAATSWTPTQPLPDGNYRAVVAIAQKVNGVYHDSEKETSDFEVDVAVPAAPTVVATADDTNARITVQVTSNSGDATTDVFEVERSLDDGGTWEPVRTTAEDLVEPTDGDETVHDYEAPNGTTVLYRARALHNYSGVYAASVWAVGSIGNLVTNPRLEEDTTGWTQNSMDSLSREARAGTGGDVPDSDWTLKVTGSSDLDNAFIQVSLTSGVTYTVSAWGRTASETGSAKSWLRVFTDTLALAGEVSIPSSGDWLRVSVTFTASSTGTHYVTVQQAGAGTTDSRWTQFQVEEGPAATTYHDGDSAGWGWTGTPHASTSGPYASASWTSTKWWLKNPNRPSLNAPVELAEFPTIERQSRHGALQPLGAAYPVVVQDTRTSPASGSLALLVHSRADLAPIDALIDSLDTLLLQGPPEDDEPDRYVRVVGDTGSERIVDKAFAGSRRVPLPFVEVAAPIGDVDEWPP